MSELKSSSLISERWREYDIPGRPEPYRIYNPRTLFVRPGGSTHRVVDKEGIVHCVPFPGEGTVLRWKARNGEKQVSF